MTTSKSAALDDPVISASASTSAQTEDSQPSDIASATESGSNSDAEPCQNLPKMPAFKTSTVVPNTGLQNRLTAFLSQMADADTKLQSMKANGTLGQAQLDNVDDEDERYIEMNLGLGVLEEKRADDASAVSDSETESEAESTNSEARTHKDTRRLGKLMGDSHDSSVRPGIVEVDTSPT